MENVKKWINLKFTFVFYKKNSSNQGTMNENFNNKTSMDFIVWILIYFLKLTWIFKFIF